MASISSATVAASTTKVAEPTVSITASVKNKVTVAVAVTTAIPVTTQAVNTTVATAAKTSMTQPGGDTTQPAQVGVKNKVITANPVTAQPTYSGINN